MSSRERYPRPRASAGSLGGANQQHVDRIARGRYQRSLRDEQLLNSDPEQWQRRTAMHMLKDFENSGVDADLEELRAGWATDKSAAAQRRLRYSRTFGDDFDEEYLLAMLDQSDLNRRGDVATCRVQMLSGLRKTAESPTGSKAVTARLAISDSMSDPGARGMTRPRGQKPSAEAELDRVLGRGASRHRDSHSHSPVPSGHTHRWRGPLEDDSDDDIQHALPSRCHVLALRLEDPHRKKTKAVAPSVSPDDPWSAWESRWAEAFRDMENMARARRQAETSREERERQRLWEEADRLREEDVRRQHKPSAARAAGSARPFWEDAYKTAPDGSASWSSTDGCSTKRPTNSSHSSSQTDSKPKGANSSGPAPKSSQPQPPRPAPGSQQLEAPRFANFAAFEEAWRSFETKVKGEGALTYKDVPWPLSLSSVSGATATDALAERKKKLRGALLRWHPDKWAPIFARVKESDKERVTEQIKEVTRRILQEKQRLE